MKKLLLLLTAGFLTLTSASGATWKKVTSEADLTLDGEYVIANADNRVLMGWDKGDKNNYLPRVECPTLTGTSTEITELPTGTAIVKFEGSAWDAVTVHLFSEDGTSKGYYYTTSAKNMSLSETGTNAKVTLSGSDITIKFGNYGSIFYNSSSPRFLNYTSTSMKKVQIFKKEDVTDTRAEAELSFTAGTVLHDINDGTTLNAEVLRNEQELTPITWSSSNTDVANIDETTGAITINATGTTTIRASFAGDDTTKPGFAEYTLNVADRNIHVMTFNFMTNDYGMERFTSNTGYNDDPTTFGSGWIGAKATGETRLWKTNGLRVYKNSTLTIYAPEGCTLTAVRALSEQGNTATSIKFTMNDAQTSATYSYTDDGNKEIAQIEVTYVGATDPAEATDDALAAKFQSGSSLSLTVKDGEIIEGTHTKLANADAEISITNVYPHATIYYSWAPEATETPEVAPLAAEAGYTEYTAPLSLDRAGTLSYYAELNGQRTATQTLRISGPTTVGINEIEVDGVATEWFDLSGRRVAAPAKGVYLRKQGAKVTKIAY